MNDYQEKALATLSGAATYESKVEALALDRAIQGFAAAANTMEQLKKQIVYGKNLPFSPPTAPISPKNLPEMDILHAKLGIAGESGEVLDANTREEVKNEVGDLLWYVALLLHRFDLDFPEVMEANIEKLAKKYKTGKFTQEEALNSTVR